jgi:hypothetical protein
MLSFWTFGVGSKIVSVYGDPSLVNLLHEIIVTLNRSSARAQQKDSNCWSTDWFAQSPSFKTWDMLRRFSVDSYPGWSVFKKYITENLQLLLKNCYIFILGVWSWIGLCVSEKSQKTLRPVGVSLKNTLLKIYSYYWKTVILIFRGLDHIPDPGK